jgi:hypothetical protein
MTIITLTMMNKVNLQDLFDQEVDQLTHMSAYTASEVQKTRASQVHKGKTISTELVEQMHESRRQVFEDPRIKEQWRQRQSESAKKRWEERPYQPTAEVIEKRRQSLIKTNAEKQAAKPIVVKQPKPRGRPRTRPLPDPNTPKRRVGRPKKLTIN